jgi:hypothetical protein
MAATQPGRSNPVMEALLTRQNEAVSCLVYLADRLVRLRDDGLEVARQQFRLVCVRCPGMIDPGEQVRVRVIQRGQLPNCPDLLDRTIRLRDSISQCFELPDLPFDIRSGYVPHAVLPAEDCGDFRGEDIQAGRTSRCAARTTKGLAFLRSPTAIPAVPQIPVPNRRAAP